MADDKTKVGRQDRARVSLSEDYEVADFARKHGITTDEARTIIAENGPQRDKIEAALARGTER